MKIRQDPRWPNAHERLKRLYDERVPEGMSQERFGAQYGIGTQGMVWQYLAGYTPLNYDAAAKFARGLRCTIGDISPEMENVLRASIMPALGRTLRRAAVLAFLALLPQLLLPSPADAGQFAFTNSRSVYYVKSIQRLLKAICRGARKFYDARIATFLVCDIFLIPRVSFPTAR